MKISARHRFAVATLPLAIFFIDAAKPAQEPAFAVASVRQSAPSGLGEKGERESLTHGPDSLTIRGMTLKRCVQGARNVGEFQISGAPWIASERFDIAAKADRPIAVSQLRLRLRTLLASRFHLTLHREMREIAVYEMTVGKKGANFQRADESEETSIKPEGGELVFRNVSMEDLASRMTGFPFRLSRPVLDRTGLEGAYDFRIRLADNTRELKMNLEQADESVMVGILESKLGLKLAARKDPLEVLVVDDATKIPTEN